MSSTSSVWPGNPDVKPPVIWKTCCWPLPSVDDVQAASRTAVRARAARLSARRASIRKFYFRVPGQVRIVAPHVVMAGLRRPGVVLLGDLGAVGGLGSDPDAEHVGRNP